jgi:hypothetical protein
MVTETPMPSSIASVLSKAICRAPCVTVRPARLSPPAAERRSVEVTEVVEPPISRSTVGIRRRH